MLLANLIQEAILSKDIILGIIHLEAVPLSLSGGRLSRRRLFHGRPVTASYPLKVIPQETLRLEIVHCKLS